MTSTVLVVPCFNESRRLPVEAFLDFASRRPDTRFLMVDDGSSDGTCAVLDRMARSSPSFSVLPLEVNVGKGEAVRRGVLKALEGDAVFIGFFDADLSTPLEAAASLRAGLESDPVLEAVFAARVKLAGRVVERGTFRHYAGRVFATLADNLLRLPFYDSQCGAKLFRAGPCSQALFEEPFGSRWIFDLEIALRLKRWGKERARGLEELVHEFPLEVWRHHEDSRLTPWDGARVLVDLVRLWSRYHGV